MAAAGAATAARAGAPYVGAPATTFPDGHREVKTDFEAGEKPALGNTAESSSPPGAGGDQKNEAERRLGRFRLLRVAQALALQEGGRAGLEYPSDWHRVATCHWHLITGAGGATIHHARAYNRSFWGGVIQCGSWWACPVCAAKIQERRRREIDAAFGWAYASGLKPVMVTLTFPHRAWHDLGGLLVAQREALRRLRAGKRAVKLKRSTGLVGLIRALELTHGRNGWHPHTHEVWFVDDGTDVDVLRNEVVGMWQTACVAAGLLDPKDPAQVGAFRERAVHVVDRVHSGSYIAKAGLDGSAADHEMASGSTKHGRRKGQTPAQLLAAAGAGDVRAGALWVAMVDALRGRPALFWSPKLKHKVGVDDRTDEETVQAQDETAEAMAQLDRDAWAFVRRKRDARAEALAVAERVVEAGGGPVDVAQAVHAWLSARGGAGGVRAAPRRLGEHGLSAVEAI